MCTPVLFAARLFTRLVLSLSGHCGPTLMVRKDPMCMKGFILCLSPVIRRMQASIAIFQFWYTAVTATAAIPGRDFEKRIEPHLLPN